MSEDVTWRLDELGAAIEGDRLVFGSWAEQTDQGLCSCPLYTLVPELFDGHESRVPWEGDAHYDLVPPELMPEWFARLIPSISDAAYRDVPRAHLLSRVERMYRALRAAAKCQPPMDWDGVEQAFMLHLLSHGDGRMPTTAFAQDVQAYVEATKALWREKKGLRRLWPCAERAHDNDHMAAWRRRLEVEIDAQEAAAANGPTAELRSIQFVLMRARLAFGIVDAQADCHQFQFLIAMAAQWSPRVTSLGLPSLSEQAVWDSFVDHLFSLIETDAGLPRSMEGGDDEPSRTV
jgi:hypothetical protein